MNYLDSFATAPFLRVLYTVGSLGGRIVRAPPNCGVGTHPALKIEFWYPHTPSLYTPSSSWMAASWPSKLTSNWLRTTLQLNFVLTLFSSVLWFLNWIQTIFTRSEAHYHFLLLRSQKGFMFNVHIPITSFQDPYDLQWPGCVMALLSRSMFNGPVLAPSTQPGGAQRFSRCR